VRSGGTVSPQSPRGVDPDIKYFRLVVFNGLFSDFVCDIYTVQLLLIITFLCGY